MSQRISRADEKRRKRNRRLITLAWVVGLGALIIFLLIKERADILYVLATLSVVTLLVVVALADLGGGRKGVDETALGDDSASIGSGIPATAAGAPS
ncbi:MAG TPA: hypothetical protein VJ715_09190, partial [Pyrinomonadaceae bacterium]|nr:hypothetical protein [Pyrinomonadaceae bacterium]